MNYNNFTFEIQYNVPHIIIRISPIQSSDTEIQSRMRNLKYLWTPTPQSNQIQSKGHHFWSSTAIPLNSTSFLLVFDWIVLSSFLVCASDFTLRIMRNWITINIISTMELKINLFIIPHKSHISLRRVFNYKK